MNPQIAFRNGFFTGLAFCTATFGFLDGIRGHDEAKGVPNVFLEKDLVAMLAVSLGAVLWVLVAQTEKLRLKDRVGT